jgi:hypothetical protein
MLVSLLEKISHILVKGVRKSLFLINGFDFHIEISDPFGVYPALWCEEWIQFHLQFGRLKDKVV